jgi:hypothetical protein
MVRRVFFSFHFQRDNWRVNQVRNSWVAQGREAAGYVDAAEWEEVQKRSEEEIKNWIDNQLHGTSVTAVLVGNETAGRKYVKYEIKESLKRGNGIVGIRVHRLKDKEGNTDSKGSNPFDDFVVETENGPQQLSDLFNTYDWKWNGGRQNIGDWIEEARQNVALLSNEQRKSIVERGKSDRSIDWGKVGIAGVGVAIAIKAFQNWSGNNNQGRNALRNGRRGPEYVQEAVERDDPAEFIQNAVDSGVLDPFLLDNNSDDEIK